MTIAAGFNFDKGILVCADTKMTAGAITSFEPKIYIKIHPSDAKSIFAISGNVPFARMAVRKCERAIEKLTTPSLDNMTDAIESVLLKVHKQHINTHPDRGIPNGPDFWLLMALWSPTDGLGAFSTFQTSIDTFDVYQCIGSGEYLGHYIIKPRYDSSHSDIKRAVSVACTALTRIKSYDANCGGMSQFVSLGKDGNISELRYFDISHIEEFSTEFYLEAEKLYSELSDLSAINEEIQASLDDFKSSVMVSRTHHKRA